MNKLNFMGIRNECVCLIKEMKKGNISPNQVMEKWPENKYKDKDLDMVYHQLGHYACDDDIRAKDPKYAKLQDKEIELYINILSFEICPPIFVIKEESIIVFESIIEAQDYLETKKESWGYVFDSKGKRLNFKLCSNSCVTPRIQNIEDNEGVLKAQLLSFIEKERKFSSKNILKKIIRGSSSVFGSDHNDFSKSISLSELISQIMLNINKFHFFKLK